MNKVYFIAILTLLAVMGCTKENNKFTPEPAGQEFTAVMEQFAADTKVSLGDTDETGKTKIFWENADQIYVFENSASTENLYEALLLGSGKTKANFFLKKKPAFDEDAFSGNLRGLNIAVYPFNPEHNLYVEGYRFEAQNVYQYLVQGPFLPELQYYKKEGFDKNSFLMAAASGDHGFCFKNMCGLLTLQLQGTATVSSIEVSSERTSLCGKTTLFLTMGYDKKEGIEDTGGSSFSIDGFKDGKTHVKLDCGVGVTLNPDKATRFSIVLPPVKAEGEKLTVTVHTVSDGDLVKTITHPHKPTNEYEEYIIYRNEILTMPVLHLPARQAPLDKAIFQDALDPDVVSIQFRSLTPVPEGETALEVTTAGASSKAYMVKNGTSATVYTEGEKFLFPENCAQFFSKNDANLEKLTTISFGKDCNTSQVTDMTEMFMKCPALEVLDLSCFDTRKVTSMAKMFYNLRKIKTLDLISFNTESVTDISGMFYWVDRPELTLGVEFENFTKRDNVVYTDLFYGSDFVSIRTTKTMKDWIRMHKDEVSYPNTFWYDVTQDGKVSL